MNFEEIILNALQTKYAGVDAKILSRIAKKKAKTATSEEDAKTIADGITFQQIIESHADYRATEAQKTAVQNYESEHNLRDGKPVEQPGAASAGQQQGNKQAGQQATGAAAQPEEKVPAWAQALIDSNKAYKERLDAIDNERTANQRLSRFRKAIEKAPDKVKTRYEKDFARLTFKDDADFDSYLEEIEPDIAEIAQQAQQAGAKVTSPLAGNGNGTEASSLVKARFEAQTKAESVAPAIAGLPTTNS